MLEVDGLVRTYGPVRALDGMTFTVEAGSVTGFLGPNGAGKTTTMRAIFGLLALDAGTVRWQGQPIDHVARRRFGYLPEERGLYPSMKILKQLRAAGLSPAQATAVQSGDPPAVEAVEAEEADAVDPRRVGVALVINILLFMMLQTYGQWVVTAVTREKASRVVEVLLAVIRPRQLLVGKLNGVGLLALGHATVLLVVGFVTARVMGLEIGAGVSLGDLALAVAWFVLGYALYCGVYAAAGSLVSRVEDAQAVAFPIMLPLLLAYIVSFSAAGGASLLLWILAFFPPTAVLAMPTLYAVGEAPLWAVFVSMAFTMVAVVVVALLAAKIYERSVLRTGKKISWREAIHLRDEIGQADTVTTAP